MNLIIPLHNKISKLVNDENIELLKQDIEDMKTMIDNDLFLNNQKGYALAHCQVSNNPYQIFVIKDKLFTNYRVIINPEIITRENPYTAKEGCLSFPFRGQIKVKRYNNVKVAYYDENLKSHIDNVSGKLAEVFQHEIEHFKGRNIYMK